MSTRCQLRFTETDTDRVAQVYRHADGYPGSILPTLDHLHDLLCVSGAHRGASYAAAQFVFVDKLRRLDRSFRCADGIYSALPDTVSDVLALEDWEEIATSPPYLLGHGVEDPTTGIHGDEEFLYVVELPARSPFDESNEWRIKVSRHCGFPRWNEDATEAFAEADWAFEGTLTNAMETVGNDD